MSLAKTILPLSIVIALLWGGCQSPVDRLLYDSRLEGADYWGDEPKILSAGLGFCDIIGVDEVNEDNVRLVGGAWISQLNCAIPSPDVTMRTSVADWRVRVAYKGAAFFDKENQVAADALPVVFSWPVLTGTVATTDFQLTLNTGEVVQPTAAGMPPNWEHNERNVVVLFGDFGNRLRSDEPGARFPVRIDIVADDDPLLLKGKGNRIVSAVGLSWTTTQSPYESGPKLVGAKLNWVGKEAVGEGAGEGSRFGADYLPNDEFALYGGGDFRLRMLTTGGFSPDGVTGVRPDMYERFFRLHVRGVDGSVVLMEKTNVPYQVLGGKLTILGLSDLGRKRDPAAGIHYDDCYVEDRDNYIDIILVGDEAAARNITHLEIPGLPGGYSAFYNPGGPGKEPYPGVRYTAPGPPHIEPVIMALDDPMRVSHEGRR